MIPAHRGDSGPSPRVPAVACRRDRSSRSWGSICAGGGSVPALAQFGATTTTLFAPGSGGRRGATLGPRLAGKGWEWKGSAPKKSRSKHTSASLSLPGEPPQSVLKTNCGAPGVTHKKLYPPIPLHVDVVGPVHHHFGEGDKCAPLSRSEGISENPRTPMTSEDGLRRPSSPQLITQRSRVEIPSPRREKQQVTKGAGFEAPFSIWR